MPATRALVLTQLFRKIDSKRIGAAIRVAPLYDASAKRAIERTIKAIHGLAELHDALHLNEIEIYIGKANRTAKAVYGRWRKHLNERNHRFGAILFRCSKKRAKILEAVGIGTVQALKRSNSLCVGNVNISPGSPGRNHKGDKSVVYVTWGIMPKPAKFEKPKIGALRELAKEIALKYNGVTRRQIFEGMRTTKSLTSRIKLRIEHYKRPHS